MQAALRLHLLTLGDPERLTGGYLYHQRVCENAALWNAQIKVSSLPDLPFPLSVLGVFRVTWTLLKDPPDVVLLDSLAAAYVGPVLPLIKLRCPVLAMIHQAPGGINHGEFRHAIQFQMDSMAYRAANELILCSHSLGHTFRELGYGETYVVEPGRDLPPNDEHSPNLDLRAGRRVALLCVANWSLVKDILSLLEAFSRLSEDLATLHLIGHQNLDTEYGREVLRRADSEELRDRVIVHGEVSPSALGAYYRASDLFVMTSLGETYGMVYGEALDAGLPIIGWRVGHLPELVEHDREGWLVEPGDLEQLREAIELLSGDEALRHRLSEGALRKAQELPTWEETTRRVVEVAKRLV